MNRTPAIGASAAEAKGIAGDAAFGEGLNLPFGKLKRVALSFGG